MICYCDYCDKKFYFKFIRYLHQKIKKCEPICSQSASPCYGDDKLYAASPLYDDYGSSGFGGDLELNNNPFMFKSKMANIFRRHN